MPPKQLRVVLVSKQKHRFEMRFNDPLPIYIRFDKNQTYIYRFCLYSKDDAILYVYQESTTLPPAMEHLLYDK
jgi:RNA binding exosome subunit